jgi:hypothetical protein
MWVQILVTPSHQVEITATGAGIVDSTFAVYLAGILVARIGENKPFGNSCDFAIVITIAIDTVTYIVTNFVFCSHLLLLFFNYTYIIAEMVVFGQPFKTAVKKPYFTRALVLFLRNRSDFSPK